MINMFPTKNGMNQVFPNETQSLFPISSETPTVLLVLSNPVKLLLMIEEEKILRNNTNSNYATKIKNTKYHTDGTLPKPRLNRHA